MKKITLFLCSIVMVNAMEQTQKMRATKAPRDIYEAIHAEDEEALKYFLGYPDADFKDWQHSPFSCRRTQITPLYFALKEHNFAMARTIIFSQKNVLGTGKLTTPMPWFGCYPSCAHRTWAVTKLADSCARLLAEQARTDPQALRLLSDVIAAKKPLQTTYYHLNGKPRATAFLTEHSHRIENLLYRELIMLENQAVVEAGVRHGLLSPAKLFCAAAQEHKPLPMGFVGNQEPVNLAPYFGKLLLQQAKKLNDPRLTAIALRACPDLSSAQKSTQKNTPPLPFSSDVAARLLG